MSHFGVRVAMNKLTIYQGATADAGANGEVNQVANALPGTPARFSQYSAINIGVETDGQILTQSCSEKPNDVCIFPAGFWSGKDVTVSRGCGSRVERTETGDTKCV